MAGELADEPQPLQCSEEDEGRRTLTQGQHKTPRNLAVLSLINERGRYVMRRRVVTCADINDRYEMLGQHGLVRCGWN